MAIELSDEEIQEDVTELKAAVESVSKYFQMLSLFATAMLGLLVPQLVASQVDACRHAVATAGWWLVAMVSSGFVAYGVIVGVTSSLGRKVKELGRYKRRGQRVPKVMWFAWSTAFWLVTVLVVGLFQTYALYAGLWYTSSSVVCIAWTPSSK